MVVKGTVVGYFGCHAHGNDVLGDWRREEAGALASRMDLLLPDPPTSVTATAGNGEATVSFKPSESGGLKTHNQLHCDFTSRADRSLRQAKPDNGKRAQNGKEYTFTVSATNSIGTGIPSQPSGCVIPKAD